MVPLAFFEHLVLIFPVLPIAIKSVSIFQSPQSNLKILLSLTFFKQALLILDNLILIEIDHLNLRLQLVDEI